MREELLRALQAYAGEDYCPEQDSFLLSLIDSAIEEVAHEIQKRIFHTQGRFEEAKRLALSDYKSLILRTASFHYDRQGKEGILSYSEGGTSGSYENSGTPKTFFEEIVPVAKIVR